MCGFLFYKDLDGIDIKQFEKTLTEISWRGPDNIGIQEHNSNILFGHCRLTILDKRPEANQPMTIEGKKILFNGEIYNHLDLRKQFNLDCSTSSILKQF